MSALSERGIVRWKEWIPLVTQQQRLRNLIQIIAYNIQVPEEIDRTKDSMPSYYYTLHLTTMSAPLYTSEKLQSENPKWSEIEIQSTNGAANGIVIRLWMHANGTDQIITAWGLYFNGLVYIGPRLVGADLSMLGPNTFVFHMHGGYFTGQHCFLDAHPVTPRTLTIQLDIRQVRPSYSVGILCSLHSLQQSIRKRDALSTMLKEQIMAGLIDGEQLSKTSSNKGRESLALRRLMNKSAQVRPHPKEILTFRKDIEVLKFRLQLLHQGKERYEQSVKQIITKTQQLAAENEERSNNLTKNYSTLQTEIENCKENKKQLMEIKSQLAHNLALLDVRKKGLMSELSSIYPIKQHLNGHYTIRGVHLPHSEDFNGKDELMISVALGFVAHLVQMMAYFLNVPTRYPICHFGSRSKIIDHIIDTIPDKDREFPLYSRGKENLPFDYGVYLMNKNIAQLRWCCGLTTEDLRQTLQNLSALMNLDRKLQTHSPRDWQRSRRVQLDEDDHDQQKQQQQRHKTQIHRSCDNILDKCTPPISQSRHTDSDPQVYLQNSQIHSTHVDKDASINQLLSTPVECDLDGREEWPLPSLDSLSITQSNCKLILPNSSSDNELCAKKDS